MRHAVVRDKMNRNTGLRRATLRDLAKATLVRQRICTTEAKAKEARKLVDRLITLGKKGTLNDKRRAFAILCDHKLVSDLFNKTAGRFKSRTGGYTRIIKLGNRRGDNAALVYLELTEKDALVVSKPKSTAAAKKEKVETAAAPEKAPAAQEPKPEKPAKQPKAEKPAPAKQKETPKEQVKETKKQFMGGIRKMFNRKSPGGK